MPRGWTVSQRIAGYGNGKRTYIHTYVSAEVTSGRVGWGRLTKTITGTFTWWATLQKIYVQIYI